MVTAAIYARKSTEQNGVADEQKSVSRQVEQARAYASGKGWSIAEQHVYIDDGIGGAEFAARPGFVRLMNALKPKATFDVLVMSEESRLGREQIEVSYALKQLVTAGVRVFCYLTDTERTLNTPVEKAMLALSTMADEMEREKARQRTYDAMSRKARAGHVTGGRVFGYNNANVRTEDGRHSHVVRQICELEAAVVRRIFELTANGHGFTSTAKTLNEEGALSPRAQRERPKGWTSSSVREVLHRALYQGEIVWNQTRKRDQWGVTKQAARPETEWLRIPAPHLRIVPEQLCLAARQQMDRNRLRYKTTDPNRTGRPPASGGRYLLTGLLQCGVCGAGMEVQSRSQSNGRRFFYGCSAYRNKGTTVCKNGLLAPMEQTDREVLAALERSLFSAAIIEEAWERMEAEVSSGEGGERLEARRRELEECRNRVRNLAAAVEKSGGSDTLLRMLGNREAEERLLADAVARLEISLGGGLSPEALGKVRCALADWQGMLRQHSPDTRVRLRQLIVNRLTFVPKNGEEGRRYEFKGTGTLEPVLAGILPSKLASPTRFTDSVRGLFRRAA